MSNTNNIRPSLTLIDWATVVDVDAALANQAAEIAARDIWDAAESIRVAAERQAADIEAKASNAAYMAWYETQPAAWKAGH